jgi:large-conductance mechanosensitive channel
MKISLIIGGILLIMTGVIGHTVIPSVISHANSLTDPLGGSMDCSSDTGNSCLVVNFAEKIFEFGTLVLASIGFLFVIYGIFKRVRKEEDLSTNTEKSTFKIIKDLFS